MVVAYIGVGSNLGKREEWIRRAVDALGKLAPALRVLRVSPLYEFPPEIEGGISPEEQNAEQIPPFLNGVIEVETTLDARALFEKLQEVERQLGRKRPEPQGREDSRRAKRDTPKPFLSRNIDLDLLFYGDEVVEADGLTVPHPRAHARAFVMIPMRDLRPDYVHPVLRKAIAQLSEG